MNVLDLFSGIGGFSLGLERAGMRTIAFCERDEFCRTVLAKHWPGVPCFPDIRTVDADGLGGLGQIDLVCGGFPCQPFSVAGRQNAQKDDRHLWPEMRRVIALARPAWVLGENVAGLIALALDDVLADLETIGYASRAFVIPACAVDARHRRDRVWIVGHSTGARLHASASTGIRSREESAGPRDAQLERRSDAMADPNHQGLSQRFRNAGMDEGQAGRYTREDSSLHCRWDPEPAVGRVANGLSGRVDRLKALGNAVVPQVVEEIGRAIMQITDPGCSLGLDIQKPGHNLGLGL